MKKYTKYLLPYILLATVAICVSAFLDQDYGLLLSAASNFAIVGSYLFIGVFLVPEIVSESRRLRISGLLFFAACAVTHADHAAHTLLGYDHTLEDMSGMFHLTNSTVQALAAWIFVFELYKLVLGQKTNTSVSKK